MENASKALIMAATILIGIIILSLGVYMYIYFSSYAQGVEDDVETNQIEQFNIQFTAYQGLDLTIYDVITLANLAKDYNQNNNYVLGTKGYINMITPITGVGSIPDNMYGQGGSDNDISTIDEKYIGGTNTENSSSGKPEYKLKLYTCDFEIDNVTRKVSKITITAKI